jgi:hypothetical protein
MQQTSPAADITHKKTLDVTSILVQNTCLQNVKLKLQSTMTVTEKVKFISMIPSSWSMKNNAKFGMV